MQPPDKPGNETDRLEKLRSYGILDSDLEPAFDDLVHLAAAVCGTPISAVSLIDEGRQWFKASIGLEVSETSRDISFCGHTILARGVTIVEDAWADARFAGNPLVVAGPHIRFYAGTPLVTPEGYALGSLCVIDRRPRTLTAEQLSALERLGRQCVQMLELRLANSRLGAALQERERAVSALQESDTRNQVVAESALDAIVAADQQGIIVSWNSAAERMFGYQRAEILGQPLSVIVPEQYRAAHARGLERMVSTGISTLSGKVSQLEGLRKDGSIFDLELSLGGWISAGRRFFSGVLRDVTAARQAAKAVKDERDFGTAVLDATDALVIVLAPDGSITRFNKACERASGYRADEVLGRRFDFLLPPEEASGVVEAFSRLTADQMRGRFENHWAHKDGGRRLVAWSNAVLVDALGNLSHVIGTGIDITDRRRAEAELGRQSAIMGSVLENMADGVLVTDQQGQFIIFNATAERMLGRGPSDGLPETWPETYGLYLPDGETKLDLKQTPLARALRGERIEQFEIFMRAPMFPLGRWHSVTASPILGASGDVIGTVSVARDITERKESERMLVDQAAELRGLALRDDLTGLSNRRGFMVLADQQIRQAQRMDRPALLVFIDLDGMKQINDRFGHEEGDRALQDTAGVLRTVFRDADIVARLGGDEFVVFAPEADDGALGGIRSRLQTALNLHNSKFSRGYKLAMSLGSTCFDPKSPRPLDALLASADAVMYSQKQTRRLNERSPQIQ